MQALPRLASRKAGLDNLAMIRAIRAIRPQRAMSLSSRLPSTAFRMTQKPLFTKSITSQSSGKRHQRTIFSMSRLPFKMGYQQQRGQTVLIQKVRFRKRRIRARTAFIWIIMCWSCYQVYAKLVLDPLEKAATQALQGMSEEELKKAEEEERRPFFIPFPGTTKELPQKPYKGSEAEWQAFVQFSRDLEHAKKVRNELADMVLKFTKRSQFIVIKLGRPVKVRRWWIDIDFPSHAPPEYERSGIEIGDDYISWVTRPVASQVVMKTRQTLWPTALFKSFWSFTTVMVGDDVRRLGKLMGVEMTPPKPTMEEVIARHKQITKMKEKATAPSKDGPVTQAPVAADPARAVVKASEKAIAGKAPEEAQMSPTTKIAMAFHAHFFRPINAFKTKLRRSWKPPGYYPPRGCILLSGLVEVQTTRGAMVVEVAAAYNPTTRHFDPWSTQMTVKRFNYNQQTPLA